MVRSQLEEFERREESLKQELKKLGNEKRTFENELLTLRQQKESDDQILKAQLRENIIVVEELHQREQTLELRIKELTQKREDDERSITGRYEEIMGNERSQNQVTIEQLKAGLEQLQHENSQLFQ